LAHHSLNVRGCRAAEISRHGELESAGGDREFQGGGRRLFPEQGGDQARREAVASADTVHDLDDMPPVEN